MAPAASATRQPASVASSSAAPAQPRAGPIPASRWASAAGAAPPSARLRCAAPSRRTSAVARRSVRAGGVRPAFLRRHVARDAAQPAGDAERGEFQTGRAAIGRPQPAPQPARRRGGVEGVGLPGLRQQGRRRRAEQGGGVVAKRALGRQEGQPAGRIGLEQQVGGQQGQVAPAGSAVEQRRGQGLVGLGRHASQDRTTGLNRGLTRSQAGGAARALTARGRATKPRLPRPSGLAETMSNTAVPASDTTALPARIEALWARRDTLNAGTHGPRPRRGGPGAGAARFRRGPRGGARRSGRLDGQPVAEAGGADELPPERQPPMDTAAGAYDKVPLKFEGWGEDRFKAAGFRAVPGAVVRRSAHIAPGVILMPSFVNVGAYVDSGTMVDTWATVGSCAQIGKNCHISGGAGIGGVLEPLQAGPVVIEDECFIGARSEVAEGVIVERGSVLSMGVYIGMSTKIIDRATGEVMYGRVPAYSVVVPGALPGRSLPDGSPGPSLYCAVIVKRVDEKTRSKTSINECWGLTMPTSSSDPRRRTREQKRELCVSSLDPARVLGKKPEHTHVVIQESRRRIGASPAASR
jgi:2,3,4,5-tetrahydropyridine-2-carboxylate N-succinyltransferase